MDSWGTMEETALKQYREMETVRRGRALLSYLSARSEESMKIKPKKCHCLRCGWDWVPLYDRRPAVCPRCKSYAWDKPHRNTSKTKTAPQ